MLKDGEEVTIALADGEMHVEESYRSKFERKHPKLFGRMMAVDAEMDPGWSAYVVALALSGVVLFGLPLKWWDGVVGEAVAEQLNSWWFFPACRPRSCTLLMSPAGTGKNSRINAAGRIC